LKTTISESKTSARPDSLKPDPALQHAFDLCARKTRGNIQRLADDPKSAAWATDGDFFSFNEGFYEIGNWTSSFFTGMALLAGRATGDESFLNEVLRLAPCYQEKVFVRFLDTHHDLGFLYSLYSVALYQLTGDRRHREVGIRAAEMLARRFNEKGNFIRAWGRLDTAEHHNMAIIDCLMNLPLLYWATKETGDWKYHQIAVRHTETTLQYFIRPDNSVVHAYRFDVSTGEPLGPDNYCGFAPDSYWARGAAWAIYGLALGYGGTRDKKYLDASLRLARNFIAQLDGDLVPVWDFRLPPSGQKPIRDTSAAAVAVCGFQELLKHNPGEGPIAAAAQAILSRLCRPDCLNEDAACPGVLRSGQVGGGGGAQNAYTSWGDYFLMEALDRALHGGATWW
jgi:unsaturated chondroitin disaccharide hydrolase